MPEGQARQVASAGARPARASGRRGRRHGVEIKPGTVKQARQDAGMSLAQVANGAVSRTAIYFVETGKAKPSMETLRLIAERTGRPLDYFLSQPSTMDARSSHRTSEIELLLATGDNAEALAHGRALLDGGPDPETAASIQQLVAMAYLRLAQPDQARPLAVAARTYFESTGDVLMVAECLGHEASAAYLQQDPLAGGLAARGLELCRSLKPVPRLTEARLLGVLGGVHLTNQDYLAAIDSYEQALAAGGVVQDLRRLSLTFSGLSMAFGEIGEVGQAIHYTRRALVIHETLNDRLSIARSENILGVLLVKRGDLAEAEGHFERSLALFEQAGVETGKANTLLSLCELEQARSRIDVAERMALEALGVAEACHELANVAEAHIWLGRLASDRGDAARVDAEFESAWGILDRLGARERLGRCHAAYAEILEHRGDLRAANRHLRLAITHLRPARTTDSADQARFASA